MPPANNPNRRSCSRSCAMSLGWHTNREQRIASISAAQKLRSAEITAFNHIRWDRPGERERLSERNRQAWADPDQRKRLSAGIRKAQSTPEKRRFYSEMRRQLWRDPVYRARVTEIVGASHRTAEYRALFSRLLRERWKDPIWRGKWIAAMKRRYRKAPAPIPERPTVTAPMLVMPSAPGPSAAPERHRSEAQIAEEAAIAAFLARKGVTKVAGVGDPSLSKLPPLEYDRTKRKYSRAPA